MAQLKTHGKCEYFSYDKCSHKDDEVMKKVTQDNPQSASPIYLLSLTTEGIDAICSDCRAFVRKVD